MNIVWEIALGIWPLLLAAAGLWAVVMLAALRRRGARWGAGLPPALAVGAAVTVGAMLWVPGWNKSALSEMGYWVDWVNLLGVAAGFGALTVAFAWPLSAMRQAAVH
jgi:hypothetical protein